LAEKTIVRATEYVAKSKELLDNIDAWFPAKVSAIYQKVDGVWGLSVRRYSTFGQYDPKDFERRRKLQNDLHQLRRPKRILGCQRVREIISLKISLALTEELEQENWQTRF
jgi:hypothetical protein